MTHPLPWAENHESKRMKTADPSAVSPTVFTSLTGRRLLNEPELNKGTAFSSEERTTLGLHGLLPHRTETLDEQITSTRDRYDSFEDDLQRHVFLRALEDTNEVLYYAFVSRHLTELLPIIYTPTVGEACEQFSHIYRRPHGLFLSYPDRHLLTEQLTSIAGEMDVIVITDGERILGLGDQGLGGMGIPIGKLSLYTAVGGLDPRRTLPVLLDVGTNNKNLLDDPMYLGWRHERVSGPEYDEFVDDVVQAIKARFPGVLLQWEDVGGHHAATLLDRYRHQLLSFNDDIQGTAAVGLATVRTAVERTGVPLGEHRICITGAGAAGCGIAAMLADEFRRVGGAWIGDKLFLTDVDGLVTDERSGLTPQQSSFATPHAVWHRWAEDGQVRDLTQLLAKIEPTILIGVSGQGGLYTEAIVRRMAQSVQEPIILPLSNPSSSAEAAPADLLRWTDGRAIVAAGSPFNDVEFGGRVHQISQANNVYIFPGLGLGALVSKASEISDGMLLAAADALVEDASQYPDSLLPPLALTPRTSRRIATAVAKTAIAEGISGLAENSDIDLLVEGHFYEPTYPTLRPPRG
ncbi:MAG: malate dehydrogenase (oxaloacetate-decarboxylating) [Acidimicrobiales bacterium]